MLKIPEIFGNEIADFFSENPIGYKITRIRTFFVDEMPLGFRAGKNPNVDLFVNI